MSSKPFDAWINTQAWCLPLGVSIEADRFKLNYFGISFLCFNIGIDFIALRNSRKS